MVDTQRRRRYFYHYLGSLCGFAPQTGAQQAKEYISSCLFAPS
jgi:hypothetical protein